MSNCRALPGLASLVLTLAIAATADASETETREQDTSRYTAEGPLGPVRLGPTVGAGAPDGLRFGVFAKWKGILAGGAAFSYLPPLTIPGVGAEVTRASGEAFARVHPFRNALFVGLAGGYVQTKGSFAEETRAFRQTATVQTHAYASAVYLAPNVGFQWMLPLGFTAGFDVGVEIPIATNGPTFDAAKYGLVLAVDGKGELADAMRAATTTPVPVIHLLELGYAL